MAQVMVRRLLLALALVLTPAIPALQAANADPRREAALQALREAAEQRPADAALQFRLSQTYGMHNMPHEALAAIAKALAVDPDNSAYLRHQAQLAVWVDDTQLARNAYKKLLAIDARDKTALLGMAGMQSRAGQLDRAVETYEGYLREYPDDVAVLLDYADTEIYRGNYAHADELQQRYLETAGDDHAYREARANLYARSGRPALALRWVEPLLAEQPDDYDLNLIRTLALNEHRQKRHAGNTLPTLDRLGALRPETAGAKLQVETSLRPVLGAGVDYYSDTDDIRIQHGELFGQYSPTPESRLAVNVDRRRLKADSGSGLDPLSGSNTIDLDEFRLSGHYRFSPQFAAGAGIGRAENDRGDNTTMYHLELDYWPGDGLQLGYHFNHDVVAVSPRAVDIFIPRDDHRLLVSWETGYRSHVDAELRYADYDDGNDLTQLTVSPRWVYLRTGKHNLDLGLSAQWFSFDKDLNNGYYDPDQYLRLWGVAYYYHKLSDNDGISVVLGLGPERDRDIDRSYELGGNLSVEGTFGIYRDWQLRPWAGVGGRFSDSGAGSAVGRVQAFRSYSFGIELIYRF